MNILIFSNYYWEHLLSCNTSCGPRRRPLKLKPNACSWHEGATAPGTWGTRNGQPVERQRMPPHSTDPQRWATRGYLICSVRLNAPCEFVLRKLHCFNQMTQGGVTRPHNYCCMTQLSNQWLQLLFWWEWPVLPLVERDFQLANKTWLMGALTESTSMPSTVVGPSTGPLATPTDYTGELQMLTPECKRPSWEDP